MKIAGCGFNRFVWNFAGKNLWQVHGLEEATNSGLPDFKAISTVEQSEERQIVELKEKAGVEKFFVDKVSAKSAKRPKFDEMMNFLREGDELIVSEFSRLARKSRNL